MKIKQKISYSFLFAVALLTGVVIIVFYYSTRSSLEKAIFERLAVTTTSRSYNAEMFLKEHKTVAEVMANTSAIKEVFQIIDFDSGFSDYIKKINLELKRFVETEDDVFQAFIIDSDGLIIASSDANKIGLDKSVENYFIEGKKNTYIKDAFYEETTQRNSVFVSTPILDKQTDETLGVFSLMVDLKRLNAIMANRNGLGETGEIYIVNKDGFMITPSRFREDVFLKQKISTVGFKECLKKYEGKNEVLNSFADIYRDYRGVFVAGTYARIPEMQWCLMAEVDETEMFASLRKVKILAMILLLAVPLAAFWIAIWVSRIIFKPLKEINKGAEIIGQGNLDYLVDIDTNDEVGQLARSFNKMTRDLKKTTTSIEELNKEIIERKKVEKEVLDLSRFPSEDPNPIIRLTKDGIVLYANAAGIPIVKGWSGEVGSVLPKLMCSYVSKVYKLEETNKEDMMIGERVFSLMFVPIVDADYVNVYGMDITERKNMEDSVKKSEANLKQAQSIAHIGSWHLDIVNNKLILSDEIYKMFGLEFDNMDVTYANFLNKIHSDDKKVVSEKRDKSLKDKNPLKIEYRIVLPSGQERIVLEKSIAAYDINDKPLYSMGTIQDITERKIAENRVQELNEVRNKFIRIVSHQLRTPLSGIRLNLEMVLKEDFGKLKKEQRRSLKATYDSGNIIINRLNDLLTVVDIEEGRMLTSKEKVSIQNLLKSSLIRFKKECLAKKIICTYKESKNDVVTFVDPKKIRAVFMYLMDNALKYTKPKGKIEIKITSKKNKIRFEITDTGIGIPKAEQHRVFEKFFRAINAFIMITDASGIGLSIAKYYVEQHGGEIGFKSIENKGSTFWFEIPVEN